MKVRRAVTAATIATAATAVLAGAAAWACTASAELSATPDAGAAGSRTTVTGFRFETSSPVEIRWATRSGPVLATTNGPSFSIEVTIPSSAAVGDYVIVGMNTDGSFAPATPFQVTSSGSTASRTTTAPGSRSGTVSGGSGQTSSTSEEPADTGNSAPATSSAGGATSPNAPSSGEGDSVPTAASSPAEQGTTRSAARGTANATRPTGTVIGGRASAITGPQARPVPSVTPVPAEEPGTDSATVVPSPLTAGNDVWNGFATGDTPVRGPALTATDAPSSGGGISGFVVGAGLLSVGMVALMAGAGLALRRRRQPAHSA
ncbi:MAG TPA: hypothetical protein VM142_13130 [Acidimicrobiales bacterium]|nr:hypothetical protein [Acidimicrobiales bacterium]